MLRVSGSVLNITVMTHGPHDVSNHWNNDRLFNILFWLALNKKWKIRITIPSCMKSTRDRRIPATKGQEAGKRPYDLIMRVCARESHESNRKHNVAIQKPWHKTLSYSMGYIVIILTWLYGSDFGITGPLWEESIDILLCPVAKDQ